MSHMVNWRYLTRTHTAVLDFLFDVREIIVFSLQVIVHEALLLLRRYAFYNVDRLGLRLVLSVVVFVTSDRTNTQITPEGNLIMNLEKQLVLWVILRTLSQSLMTRFTDPFVFWRSAFLVSRMLRKQDDFVGVYVLETTLRVYN